jgi:hypothetical protein
MWKLPKAHAKAAVHDQVEKLMRDHMRVVMGAVEKALSSYKPSGSAPGTESLSFMEWESLLRLVGINLGEHFSSHMLKRVCVRTLVWSSSCGRDDEVFLFARARVQHKATANILTLENFKRELAEYFSSAGAAKSSSAWHASWLSSHGCLRVCARVPPSCSTTTGRPLHGCGWRGDRPGATIAGSATGAGAVAA